MTGSSEPLKDVYILHPGTREPRGPLLRAGHIPTLRGADWVERTFLPGELATYSLGEKFLERNLLYRSRTSETQGNPSNQ